MLVCPYQRAKGADDVMGKSNWQTVVGFHLLQKCGQYTGLNYCGQLLPF